MRVRAPGEEIALPPRQMLPPSAWGAAGALVASALLMQAGWSGFSGAGERVDPGLILFAALGFVIAGLAARVVCKRGLFRSCLVWCLVGVAIGSASSAAGIARRDAEYREVRSLPISARIICVRGDPSVGAYGSQSDADVLTDTGERVASVAFSSEEPYAAATKLSLVGRVSPLSDDEWGRGRYMSGLVAEVDEVKLMSSRSEAPGPIEGVRQAVLDAMGPQGDEARALVAGIVCGRTTELGDTAAAEAFSATGTTHLVAVSGSHLALISALVGGALIALGVRPAVRLGTMAVLMGTYVVFTGCAPSAVRSFVMVVADMVARALGRRPHGPSGLALAVMVLVAADAGVVYDLGFQLSAGSVLFIQLFFRYLEVALERIGLPRAVGEPLALTLSAQWATIPITAPVFGEVSLVSPFANLMLGPVMSALLVCGVICAPLAVVLPFADFVLAPATLLARASIFIAELCSGLPGATVALDPEGTGGTLALWAYGAAAVIYLLWRLPTGAFLRMAALVLAAAGLVRAACAFLFAPASIVVMDVGQADAILIREGPQAVLVDAGVDDAVVGALARQGVMKLDAVVVTHWDSDHWGGLPAVLSRFSVGCLIVAAGADDAVPDEVLAAGDLPIETVRQGDTIFVGRFTCTAVWPLASVEGTENEDSLCLEVRYGEEAASLAVLLTGDAERAEVSRIVDDVGDIDVLKLGHHGSAASVDDALLEELDPEVAVASAGEGNRYGHPSEEAVENVRRADCAFLCTYDAGDVCIRPTAAGYEVKTQREPMRYPVSAQTALGE